MYAKNTSIIIFDRFITTESKKFQKRWTNLPEIFVSQGFIEQMEPASQHLPSDLIPSTFEYVRRFNSTFKLAFVPWNYFNILIMMIITNIKISLIQFL